MRQVNPAMPPHIAVTASPRTGSSSFNASRAPTTAPKNEAAHARKGVSSHPKIRKSRRTQRMGLIAALPHRRENGSQHQAGQEGQPEGGETPVCPGEACENRDKTEHDRSGTGHSKCNQWQRLSTSAGLIGQYPGAEPREERAYHPPHRVVPPVATPTNFIPSVR